MSRAGYKVLHAPTSVGGHPQGLSRALVSLGVDSVSWIHQQTPFEFRADRVLWPRAPGLLRREWLRLVAICRAVREFDLVHYNFGTTLSTPVAPPPRPAANPLRRLVQALHRDYLSALCRVELGCLRVLGKPVFVHYQGDDARQGDVLRSRYAISTASRVGPNYYYPASDEFKRAMIRRMDAACDQIYALNPDLMHVLPARAKFQPYAHVRVDELRPVYTQLDVSRPLRIGHAPSHRSVKGTDLIIAALDRLRAEGFGFELVLVEGLPNQEAIQLYMTVDVVVDQMYAGWYGGLAVEVMALGKPVVAYLREEDLHFIPVEMRQQLPIVRTQPDSIEDDLRQLLRMPRAELAELAHRSRAFVEHWHDPRRIAEEIKADYEDALRKRGRL